MNRHLAAAAVVLVACLSVAATALASNRPTRATSEMAAVRHAYAELATASVKGPASTLCSLLSAADAAKFLEANFPGTHTCVAAARKFIANYSPQTLRAEGSGGACAANGVKHFGAELAKALTDLRYVVLSSSEVQVESSSQNYLFEANETELWQKVGGRWIDASGLPPLFSVQC